MIQLKGVRKSYKAPDGSRINALSDVNLEVGRGEIYGVIGYSGAGKSTLVRCVNFLEIPDEGVIAIDGFGSIRADGGKLYITEEGSSTEKMLSEKNLRKLRCKIGMIFQHFNLLDRCTVFENVAYPLKYTGRSKNEIEKRVLELLELVELCDKVDAYPSQLSGGQKQRVAIARALANDPAILLSDEATSALDPEVTESILELLKSLNRKLGLTIIMITHEMSVIKSICSHVAVMESGRIVEEGSVYNIFSSPQKVITRRFVSATSGLNHLGRLLAVKSPLVCTDENSVLVTLSFGKDSVGEALISETSRKYEINLSIVLANVDLVQETPIGYTVVLAKGDRQNIDAALDYLRSKSVEVEVINDGRIS